MPFLDKLQNISISTISIILMAFILINPQLFFLDSLLAWQNVIFVYILLYLVAAKNSVTAVDDRILNNPFYYVLLTMGVLLLVSVIGIESTTVPPAFNGWLAAFIYTFAVVAFVETKVFIQWLPNVIGLPAACVLFGLFHVGIYLNLIAVALIPALIVAMVFNYILSMVFIYSKSLYLVMLIHTVVNLAIWGYLSVMVV